MSLTSHTHVQYVLAKFDAGVPPHRILMGLQLRASIPLINVETIEQCLRENGRLVKTFQLQNAAKVNQSLELDRDSYPPPPAIPSNPGSSATTQQITPPTDIPSTPSTPGPSATFTQHFRRILPKPAGQTFATNDLANPPADQTYADLTIANPPDDDELLITDDFVHIDPTLPLDAQAERVVNYGYEAGDSIDTIYASLQSIGNDLTPPEVENSLKRQDALAKRSKR